MKYTVMLSAAKHLVMILATAFIATNTSAATPSVEIPVSTAPASSQMYIDRVEIIGSSGLTNIELADNLDIPLNKPISSAEIADILIEAERRLKASGKYEDDVALKLLRGPKYQHYLLEIHLTEIDNFYFGIDSHHVQGPWSLEESDFKLKQSSTDAEFYWGTRDYDGSGLGLDLEFMSDNSQLGGKLENNYGEYNYKADFFINGFTASAIQKGFLNRYAYIGLIARTFSMQNWSDNSSNYSIAIGSKTYKSTGSSTTEEKAFVVIAEPVFGVHIDKLQLGGKLSRIMDRTYRSRSNHDETTYIDDVLQPPSQSYSSGNTPGSDRYSLNNSAEFSIAWTDKSRLTVIEPGLDIHATWTRDYYDQKTDPPKFETHAEETILLSDRFAWTFLADGEWEYRDPSATTTKLKRTFDVGSRLDYVSYEKIVVFGEFYRVGARRGELSSDSHYGTLAMGNRINAGLKYASPTFIYSLALGYGVPVAGENFFGASLDSVYHRLGVR